MKKTFRNIILSLLLVVTLLSPVSSYATPQNIDVDYLNEIEDFIKDNYIYERKTQDIQKDSLKGLFNGLDKYSTYYTEEEFEQLNQDLHGSFVGIGAYISSGEGFVKVVKPIKESPAEYAGILAGDKIITIDGKSTMGLTAGEATKLIKGEINTVVKLRIKRNGYTKLISVTRDNVTISPVDYEIIDDIGYITLDNFTYNSYFEIKEALDYMDKNEITKIIFDIRGNPGGLLDEVVDIGGLFVPKGPIVHIKYVDGNIESYGSNLEDLKYKLVVLVDKGSASASEILAGAIKDTKAGQIVGVTTYGKGTVQKVVSLPKGDGMKLTIAEYFSPNMNKIEGLGVEPDIVVENQEGEDTQLKKAIEILSSQTFTLSS